MSDGSTAQTMLATFAKGGHGTPGNLPVYRSTDGGTSWGQISTITSHTAGWDIEAPTLYEVPRSIPGLNQGDVLAAGTAWQVGNYSAQKVEVFRSTDKGQTWQFLSNCTSTSGLPNTWGHGIWEPTFLVTDNDTLACFISDERPANSATNNQLIGHYSSTNGGVTWSSSITPDVSFPSDTLARPGMQTFAALPEAQEHSSAPKTAGSCCTRPTSNTEVNGRAIQLYTCNGVPGQQWTMNVDGTIRAFGKCIDVDGAGTGTANSTKIELWDCNGSSGQQWVVQANGSVQNPGSGRCLDTPAGNAAAGVDLALYDCNGLWPQQWKTPV